MSASIVTTQLQSVANDMAQIATAIGNLDGMLPEWEEIARDRANRRKIYHSPHLIERFSAQHKHVPQPMRNDQTVLAAYIKQKRAGLQRAHDVLTAFGYFVDALAHTQAKEPYAVRDLQRWQEELEDIKPPITDITQELIQAQNWLKAEERDSGRNRDNRIRYMATPFAADTHMCEAVQAIDQMIPALHHIAPGPSILPTLMAEADACIRIQSGWVWTQPFARSDSHVERQGNRHQGYLGKIAL